MGFYSREELRAMGEHSKLVDIAESANKAVAAGLTVTAPEDWEGFNLVTCPECKGVGEFANLSANARCDYCMGSGVADGRGLKWRLSRSHGGNAGVRYSKKNWLKFKQLVKANELPVEGEGK